MPVIVPSEWYENNPMTIIEAYSVGTPVIGAQIGGIPEIIAEGETGYQFKSGNMENLGKVIAKAMALSKNEYEALSSGCLRFAHNNLSPESYYPRLMAFYQQFSKK